MIVWCACSQPAACFFPTRYVARREVSVALSLGRARHAIEGITCFSKTVFGLQAVASRSRADMEAPAETYFADDCECIRTMAVKKHEATDESQLNLKVNDIIIVLEKDETGWWGGHKENDDKTGWFPGSCVRSIPQAKRQSEQKKPESNCKDSVKDGLKDGACTSVA